AEGAIVLQPILDQLERGPARDEERHDRGGEDDETAQGKDGQDVGNRDVAHILFEAVEAARILGLFAGLEIARSFVGHRRADCNPGPRVRQGASDGPRGVPAVSTPHRSAASVRPVPQTRLFTLEEANEEVPRLAMLVERLQRCALRLDAERRSLVAETGIERESLATEDLVRRRPAARALI